MAARLSEQLQASPPLTDTGIRKTLQRAKEQFGELICSEVAGSLEQPALHELEQELIDLGLIDYCRSALKRRKSRREASPVDNQ